MNFNRSCDWITGLTSARNLIAHHLKYCFNHSEMPDLKSIVQMIWYVTSLNRLTQLRSQTSSAFEPVCYCVSSACFEVEVIYYLGRFCSLEHMARKRCVICKLFMQYSNFPRKLHSQQANDK